ncbi:hypothetical protein DRJ48_01520 [Candidatus Woesearchaeota archaeon]|nr:DHH family phosphoesterase [Candidatus Woesearchaeota archaeon]RLE43202.1 MAG: hypothetical protein DRJ48_01520 [Candidatus Woesearchaeota archaeon]
MQAKIYKKLLSELETAKRPIFFFDDDPDGLASFLLLYRYRKEGKGVIIKSTPRLVEENARKVEEYSADKVFVLDLPLVDQGFIDKARVPVIWIDHHQVVKRENVLYFNPREDNPDAYVPVSWIAYNVVNQDIWIAATGVVGDFCIPDFLPKFKQEYPGYIGSESEPEEILFNTKLGKLVSVFSMVLKGRTKEVMQCVKVLTRIKHPDEILKQSTPQGKFIWRHYLKHWAVYEKLLREAVKHYTHHGKLFVFVYPGDKLSLTADLALELIYRYPHKIVIVAREKNGEMKISIRARGIKINKALEKALEGVEGYGGGHEYACGANVKKGDFKRFLEQFRESLNI